MFLNYEITATPAEVKGYIQTMDENGEIIDLFYYEYDANGAILNTILPDGSKGFDMAVNREMVIDFIAKFEN
ncbi:MAG: hypothetical protein WC748_09910 [Legionellales bacterium]|jgi:hypothetical protein